MGTGWARDGHNILPGKGMGTGWARDGQDGHGWARPSRCHVGATLVPSHSTSYVREMLFVGASMNIHLHKYKYYILG
jgi:hypothetical protein